MKNNLKKMDPSLIFLIILCIILISSQKILDVGKISDLLPLIGICFGAYVLSKLLHGLFSNEGKNFDEPIKNQIEKEEVETKKNQIVKEIIQPVEKQIEKQEIKRRTAFEYSYEELPKINFSELRKSDDNDEPFIIPKLSEDETDKLKKMAQTFWSGDDRILKESSGNPEQDKYSGMFRLYEYIKSWLKYGYSFFENTEIERGLLKYRYDSWSGTCYDGGCYSDDSDEYYFCIERVPIDKLENEFRKKWDTYHDDVPKHLGYQGELHGADCIAFYTRRELWLMSPFGLKDGFHIYID